jgi:nucleoside-diphosphate-sugar epimerase
MASYSTLSVLGATGFIGGHLLTLLAKHPDLDVRALAHATKDDALFRAPSLKWIRGGLEDANSLRNLLVPGGDLVHLAFPTAWTPEMHIRAAQDLGELAAEMGVRRIVLCSTAVVTGRTVSPLVDETTPCAPLTDYERGKLGVEEALRQTCSGRVELVVLRPAAVFGSNGLALRSLVASLAHGNRFLNYVRSSLYGRRAMHLVPVENVLAAIMYARELSLASGHETFIVSNDDDPLNNFHDVEQILMASLGLQAYPIPLVRMPAVVLKMALHLKGRSEIDPAVNYRCDKLLRAGFVRPVQLVPALQALVGKYQDIGRKRLVT